MVSSSNTALGYQMMIEGIILHSMTGAANTGNWYIASAYAKAYADFIGLSDTDYPKEPMLAKSRNENIAQWEQYYFNLLSVIFKKVNQVLAEVRRKYKTNTDIPTVSS